LLGAVLAAVLVAGRWMVVRRLVLVVAVAAAVAALPVRLVTAGWPPRDWLAVACDVGQGDAVVLSAGPGAAVVVDAGPEPAAVDRCLRRLGVSAVPILVISHFHADHVGGVDGVLASRSVQAVVTTAFPEPATGRAAVGSAAQAVGVPVWSAPAGWSVAVGRLRLTALSTVEPLLGTRSDPNNNSLVLRVVVGGHTLLLAADAEAEQQRALLGAYGAAGVRAEVVKLAHHGSAFQDPDFLDAVGAGAALVSVGAGNGYGHPNAAVLDHLARLGSRIMRTDRDGDVAVVADGHRLAVVARGLEPGRPR
jgi:competence protein ComEC